MEFRFGYATPFPSKKVAQDWMERFKVTETYPDANVAFYGTEYDVPEGVYFVTATFPVDGRPAGLVFEPQTTDEMVILDTMTVDDWDGLLSTKTPKEWLETEDSIKGITHWPEALERVRKLYETHNI